MMRIIWLLFIINFLNLLSSQPVKFGQISKEELNEKKYPGDSFQPAAFLYSSTEIIISWDMNKGLIAKKNIHKRLKIYRKRGKVYASEKIRLRSFLEQEEKFDAFGGFIYRILQDSILKIPLDSSIITKKSYKGDTLVMFSIPNVQPDDVIEWHYTITTPKITGEFTPLQDEIPIKKLHFSFAYPDEKFSFYPHIRGFVYFNILQRVLPGNLRAYQIDKKNIPPFLPEPFSGNVENYRAGIAFQLLLRHINPKVENLKFSWDQISYQIYSILNLKEVLHQSSYFKKDLEKIIKNASPSEKIKVIYEWTKEKIHWDQDRETKGTFDLINAYNKGKGNATEINLNFINFLHAAGFEAYPVLISTEEHGIPLFPYLFAFDRMITAIKTPQGLILTDASEKLAPLGVLPENDINYKGRIIKDDGSSEWINLYPKKPARKLTSLDFTFSSKTSIMQGTIHTESTRQIALNRRKILRENNPLPNTAYKKFKIKNIEIEAKNKIYAPLKEHIELETRAFTEQWHDTLTIYPFLGMKTMQNPFTNEIRQAPVIFYYPRTYILKSRITLPDNYEIIYSPPDFQKENAFVASYYYTMKKEDNVLIITSILKLQKAIIEPIYYKKLKALFEQKDSHENQPIILRKIH